MDMTEFPSVFLCFPVVIGVAASALRSSFNALLTSSVQPLSRVQLSVTPWTAAHQASLSKPTPGVYSNSCPSSLWYHPAISSFIIPFSSCLQSFPASGSFPMSPFFESGGQSIGVSASASVLPMNIQDWFPLPRTGWISLQSFSTIAMEVRHHYLPVDR